MNNDPFGNLGVPILDNRQVDIDLELQQLRLTVQRDHQTQINLLQSVIDIQEALQINTTVTELALHAALHAQEMTHAHRTLHANQIEAINTNISETRFEDFLTELSRFAKAECLEDRDDFEMFLHEMHQSSKTAIEGVSVILGGSDARSAALRKAVFGTAVGSVAVVGSGLTIASSVVTAGGALPLALGAGAGIVACCRGCWWDNTILG